MKKVRVSWFEGGENAKNISYQMFRKTNQMRPVGC